MTDEPTAAAAQDNIVQLDADQKTVIDTSEIDLSMRFASLHENDIKYVGQWSRWLCYNGRSWDIDHSMKTYESAKQMLVKIAKRMYNAEMHARTGDIDKLGLSDRDKKNQHKTARKEALKIAKAVKGSKTVAAVVSLSRSDPKFITVGELWDSNPWLLNTPDGTINLKTGYVRDHNHRDFITMSTAVGPSARSPERWLEFMRTITDGDEMLQGYLQRVLGYCLSGQVGEHAMFFGFGTGANGKSVMLNTIGGLLGDYHKIMAMETLIITQEYRHPTELADLRGARMVTASETQKGRSWDEVKVKHLTGGDKVKARFMRQDFFEYKPQFKLFVAGNHKPAITSVDEAMRRRFNLIPFTVTIPAAQRDPYLADRLKAEWPQILNWMIEGCLEWQQHGLQPPLAVIDATDIYMSLEDSFTAWFNECCEHDISAFTLVSKLYDSWSKWNTKNSERPGSKKSFSQTILGKAEALKIRYRRGTDGRGFDGVAIK